MRIHLTHFFLGWPLLRSIKGITVAGARASVDSDQPDLRITDLRVSIDENQQSVCQAAYFFGNLCVFYSAFQRIPIDVAREF